MRTVLGPGGFDPELLLAEWSSGWRALRYVGRGPSQGSHGVVALLDPGGQKTTWICHVAADLGTPPELSVNRYMSRTEARLELGTWLSLARSTLPEGWFQDALVGAVLRSYARWGAPAAPGELLVPEELLLYQALGEVHPVWQGEERFREWLDGSLGVEGS